VIHLALLTYAAAMMLGAILVQRLPELQPPPVAFQRPALFGFVYLSVLLGGIGFGLVMPTKIVALVSEDWRYGVGVEADLGVIGPLAQLVGAVTGAWIAIRGLYLWVLLTLAYAAVLVVGWTLSWVMSGTGPW
jgi:hypothetical protein